MKIDINSNNLLFNKVQAKNIISPLHGAVTANNTNAINNPVHFGESFDSVKISSVAERFLNVKAIAKMMKANPKIKTTMKDMQIPIHINMITLKHFNSHFQRTRSISAEIYKNLPKDLQAQVNCKELEDAAMLHDIAKGIIPSSIVNSPGKLEGNAKHIMDQHANLSYELLKTTGISQNTLEMIKNHHSPDSLGSRILSAADVYDALTTERTYKKAMPKKQALEIIQNEHVATGKIDQDVYNALSKVADRLEFKSRLNKIYSQGKSLYKQVINSLSAIFTKGKQVASADFTA